jgi:hypothetical protein
MLPEISQQLLRKARAGQIYHSPVPATNGKDDKSKPGSKEAEGVFVSKKWTLVARDQEAEEPAFLAKRRKGLPPTFGVGLSALVPQTSYRTAKVKKYDADGTMHVYEVLAPEGQQVEGEIVAEDEAAKDAPVEPIAAAPGTVVEGLGVVNEHGIVVSNDLLQPTPPRRKPPPPRRKPKKGPGRGRKKVLFENGESGNATNPDGTPASGLLNVPGVAAERTSDSAVPSSQGDTPMPDAGEDDEGSGSEGEEGEEGEDGREEGELSPSPEPEKAVDAKSEPAEQEEAEEEEAAAVPTTEVKEEQNEDDPMETEEQLQQPPEEVPSEDAATADATALPGLPSARKSPSPPAHKKINSAPASAPSSPKLPLASTSSGTETQIPGLPALTTEGEEVAEPADTAPKVDAKPVVESLDKHVEDVVAEPVATADAAAEEAEEGVEAEVKKDVDGDVDLLGRLEATLDQEGDDTEKKDSSA